MADGSASDVLTKGSRRAKVRSRQTHFVYQLWGSRGCIYVGLSSEVPRRLVTHSRTDWWPSVVRIQADRYEDKDAALAAEKDLIESLDPWVNVQGAL